MIKNYKAIKIEDRGKQRLESLLYLIKEMELDKLNYQASDSLIDFSF